MDDQEMQFADPDWKPTRPLNAQTGSQEQEVYTPQPINIEREPRQQPQWQTPAPPSEEGYAGLGPQIPPLQRRDYMEPAPYAGPVPQSSLRGQSGGQQYRRRSGRGPWFWIILALIIIGLMSGGFGSAFRGFDHGHGFGPQNSVEETKDFKVSSQAQPTIVINDQGGGVRVHTGSNAGDVHVQASEQPNGFGNSNRLPVNYQQSSDGNTITITFDGGGGSVDFDVTVPANSNLQLTTSSGDITADGVSGQMTLSTDSGDITATNDTFTGIASLSTNSGEITARGDELVNQAKVTTSSGDITFQGTLDANGGTYQFITDSGTIDATLGGNGPFQVNASTSSGSIHSDIQTINVHPNDSGGTAQGYVGRPGASTNVTLTTNSGSINIHGNS